MVLNETISSPESSLTLFEGLSGVLCEGPTSFVVAAVAEVAINGVAFLCEGNVSTLCAPAWNSQKFKSFECKDIKSFVNLAQIYIPNPPQLKEGKLYFS